MAIKSAVMIVVNTRECRCDKNDNGNKKRMFVELTRKWFQGGGLMPVIKGVPCCASQMKKYRMFIVRFRPRLHIVHFFVTGSLQYPIVLICNYLLNG